MDIVWQLAASLLLGTSRVLDTLCTSINRSVVPQPNSCFTDSNFRAYIMQQPSKKFWVADCNMCTFAASALSHAHVQTGFNFWFQFSHSVMSDSLWPHGQQHARLPCPPPTPEAYSNSCPLSQWCHATVSSYVIPFSSHLQYFPASGSFQMCQFFTSGGQRIGVSASISVLPKNIQDCFPLGWTDWISLQFNGFSRVFSNTTVQKHQFFCAQLSL